MEAGGRRGAPGLLPGAQRELAASGELVESRRWPGPTWPRSSPPTAGAPVVTDGPFPEFKEWLAGYQIVDVESEERALEIAGRLSAVPGPGGVPIEQPIQVRQVMTRLLERAEMDTFLEQVGGELSAPPRVEDLLRELAPQVLGTSCAGTATSTPPRTPSRRR